MKTLHGFILACLFALTFTSSTTAASSIVPVISEAELGILNRLAGYLDKGRRPEQAVPDTSTGSCPVSAVSTALQFANAPARYKQALFEQYSIDDYSARARGIYNTVSSNEVLSVVKVIETKYPQITDGRIQMAIAFCAFRDRNIWFNSKQGRISAARFFRSAFLASVFKGTTLDAVKITSEIDQKTWSKNLP